MQSLLQRLLEIADKAWVEKTVYHGTSTRYLQNILKVGLQPRSDKWMVSRAPYSMRKELLGRQPKELYVTTNIELARNFANDAAHYGGKPIVLSFTLDSADNLIFTDKYLEDEFVINSMIVPDRLEIVEPRDFDVNRYMKNIAMTKFKTSIIRELNKILKKYDIRLKSGSKTTHRVLAYEGDQILSSCLLEEIKEFILQNGENEELTWLSKISSEDADKIITQIDKLE